MHNFPAATHATIDRVNELRRRIARAEHRLDQSRSDAEFAANDDLIAHYSAQLRDLERDMANVVTLPHRTASAPRSSSRAQEQARPVFAATPAGRATSSGTTPAARAAGDLRLSVEPTQNTKTPELIPAFRPRHLTPDDRAAAIKAEVFDGLVTLFGMMTLATIALFFLVLA